MTQAEPPKVSSPGGLSPLQAFTEALSETQSLLSGAQGRRRWRRLAAAAALAGIVGVGVQPPPVGLLHPVWEDAETRRQLLAELRGQQALLGALALVGLLFAAAARCFTFQFLEHLSSASPKPRPLRSYLRPGLAHFFWSSLLTLPLYALLVWAEALVAGDAWRRLLTAPDERVAAEVLAAALRFLLVLVPWVIATLPVMVLLYELTPTVMAREKVGPVRGAGRVLASVRGRPGLFLGYLGVRLLLQLVGTGAATVALLPCLVAVGVLGAPVLLAGWAAVSAAGGLQTPAGIWAASTAGVIVLVLLYALLCAALVPVSTLLYVYARRFLQAR